MEGWFTCRLQEPRIRGADGGGQVRVGTSLALENSFAVLILCVSALLLVLTSSCFEICVALYTM